MVENVKRSDVAYSTLSKDSLELLQKSLGYPYLRDVTYATLTPERMLYHACLVETLFHIVIPEKNELERGKHIAAVADKLYQQALPLFQESVKDNVPALRYAMEEATSFLSKMHKNCCSQRVFNKAAFLRDYAGESTATHLKELAYAYGRIRVQQEQNTRQEDEKQKSLGMDQAPGGQELQRKIDEAKVLSTALEWAEHLCKRDYCWDRAHEILHEQFIKEQLPDETFLNRVQPSRRKVYVFTGGMGAGKSILTAQFFGQIRTDINRGAVKKTIENSIMMNDADDLKYALGNTAIREAKLETSSGREVHDESMQVVYELGEKLNYSVRSLQPVPHMAVNYTSLSLDEEAKNRLQDLTAMGSQVWVFHISVDPEVAISSAISRQRKDPESFIFQGILRAPTPEEVEESCKKSAVDVFNLINHRHVGSNIKLCLYERPDKGASPELVAAIDMRQGHAFIRDFEAFRRLAARSLPNMSPDEAVNKWMDCLQWLPNEKETDQEPRRANMAIFFADKHYHDTICFKLDGHALTMAERTPPGMESCKQFVKQRDARAVTQPKFLPLAFLDEGTYSDLFQQVKLGEKLTKPQSRSL